MVLRAVALPRRLHGLPALNPAASSERWPLVDRPIFFVHLQKTGGTSLLFQFRALFEAEQIFPNKDDGDPLTVGPQFVPDRLVEGWERRGGQLRLIIGHYPYAVMDRFGTRFITMTVLRDPVERTLSYLRHHRFVHPEDRGRGLVEIYEDPFRYRAMIHNHMVKMLGMTAEEMAPEGMLTELDCTDDHLERAMMRLSRFDVVGLQSDMADFTRRIRGKFGLPVEAAVRVNETPPMPVEQSFRDRIERDNALDVRLWRFAVDLVGQTTDR